ncbi:MAG: hypothetical protein JWQ38_199 [Flavipsychrobacter sp.]|nr:hypothetical protein [Flavipsychrobacter sp.]
MKQILLTISLVLLIVPGISAQVILTQTSYPVTISGTDSVKVTTYNSAFPSLAPIAGGLWDVSIVTDSTPLFLTCHLPDFSYQYADSNISYSRGGFAYNGNARFSVAFGGLLEYGVIVKRDSYDLFSFTGGAFDTLVITAQHLLYSSPCAKIAFPATYNTKWSSSYSSDLAIELSVAPGLSHAPGYMRRYVTEVDSVTGWGKMRVKDFSGVPSDSFHVLQVQTRIATTDSFFVNGAPFPGILVTQLNLQQGQSDTIYQQNYYQPMQVTPLAQVTFTDGTYSQPRSALTQVKQMIGTTGKAGMTNEGLVHVYPNPVSGNNISVTLPNTKRTWAYALVNISGKVIKKGELQINSMQASLEFPASVTTGIYYLKLTDNEGNEHITPIDVIR